MDDLISMDLPVPFPGCYWVIPQILLAGGHPGRGNEQQIRGHLDDLLRAGVRAFIDLTSPQEMSDYQAALNQAAREMDVDVSYHRLPIVDFSIPGEKEMREILDDIERHNQMGRSVYLHCWGGIGRTGTVVGCYLVRNGLTGEQALQHIKSLRTRSAAGTQPSPETAQQVDMVKKWQR